MNRRHSSEPGTGDAKPEYLYGLHAVASVFKYRPNHVLDLQVKAGKSSPAVAAIVARAREHGVAVTETSSGQLRRLTNDGVHQGVVVRAERRRDLDEKALEQRLADHERNFLLVLDGVDDPRNLGACLRVADGAGVDGVIMARSRGASVTPLVAKVASGAAESVPCYRVANLARTLRFIGEAGVQIIGAADESATSVYDIEVDSNTALVIGGEGAGLRQLTRKHCDLMAKIPMHGTVESLNLAVAAGIMLYQIQIKRT